MLLIIILSRADLDISFLGCIMKMDDNTSQLLKSKLVSLSPSRNGMKSVYKLSRVDIRGCQLSKNEKEIGEIKREWSMHHPTDHCLLFNRV